MFKTEERKCVFFVVTMLLGNNCYVVKTVYYSLSGATFIWGVCKITFLCIVSYYNVIRS